MFKEYPYTDYHDLNLDYLMNLCRCSMGLHLEVVGDKLQLKNANDQIISDVTIHYADTALEDVDGNKIKSYIIQAGTDESHLLLTHGDSNVDVITIPFATKAEKDVNEHDITSYIRGLGVSGNQILVTRGDGSTFQFTVPFANKAKADENGKNITTYVANLAIANDKLVVSDGNGNVLSELTITYAVRADNDGDGDPINTTYVTSLGVGTTTVKALNKKGDTLNEITVPYATMALEDTDGNRLLSDYAETLVVDGQRIGLEAHDGTRLSTVTVPFATLATDATNAVEAVAIVGDQMVFTTYGGREFAITAPYAVKAQKDDLGNVIKSTYIASVTNDTETGELTFLDATGAEIVTLIPTVNKATHDSYNNLIADYVKQIIVDAQSNYVRVVHGTGDTDSLIINYSVTAWKDTNDNVIKNTYIKRLACEEDVQDGKYKLVAYDGDTPEAELFRIALICDMAAHDINGKDLTSYLAHIAADGNDLISKDGEDTEVDRVTVPFATNATNAEFAKMDDNGKDIDSYVAGATLSGTDLILYDGNIMPIGNPIDLSDLVGVNLYEVTLKYSDSNTSLDPTQGILQYLEPNTGSWEVAQIRDIKNKTNLPTTTTLSTLDGVLIYKVLVEITSQSGMNSVPLPNAYVVRPDVNPQVAVFPICEWDLKDATNPVIAFWRLLITPTANLVTAVSITEMGAGGGSGKTQIRITLATPTQTDIAQMNAQSTLTGDIGDIEIDGVSGTGMEANQIYQKWSHNEADVIFSIAYKEYAVVAAYLLFQQVNFVLLVKGDGDSSATTGSLRPIIINAPMYQLIEPNQNPVDVNGVALLTN